MAYGDVRDTIVALPHFSDVDEYAILDRGGLPLYPVRAELANIVKPDRVFEFGAYRGYCLVAFATGWSMIDTIGWVDNETHTEGSNELCRANLASVTEAELEYTEHAWESPWFEQADLVQVDSDHSYDGCMLDLIYALRLGPRAILVDDYTAIGEVRTATDDFARAHALPGFWVPTVNGLAVLERVPIRGDLEKAGYETRRLTP